MTRDEGRRIDQLANGLSIHGAPGACGTCGHGKVWHSPTDRRRPCERCECRAYQRAAAAAPVAELSPAGQLDLFGADPGQIFGQVPLFGGTS